jgi:hypothetical protein
MADLSALLGSGAPLAAAASFMIGAPLPVDAFQPVTYAYCGTAEDGSACLTSKFTVAKVATLTPEVANACVRHLVFVLVRCNGCGSRAPQHLCRCISARRMPRAL